MNVSMIKRVKEFSFHLSIIQQQQPKMKETNSHLLSKILTSVFLAALIGPCLYMCIKEGVDRADADTNDYNHDLMLRGDQLEGAENLSRSWLRRYVATPRNPDHKRAMVETLIRYGTTHVKPGIKFDDVKDALAIEFLSQVDGKPVPIAGMDNRLFIGTIGTAYNPQALKDTGITHIISAAPSARANYELKYLNVNLSSKLSSSEIYDLLLITSTYIENVTSKNDSKVLVVDWEGADASAAIILAHIIITKHISFADAKRIVVKTRPGISVGKRSIFLSQLQKIEHDVIGNDTAITTTTTKTSRDLRVSTSHSSDLGDELPIVGKTDEYNYPIKATSWLDSSESSNDVGDTDDILPVSSSIANSVDDEETKEEEESHFLPSFDEDYDEEYEVDYDAYEEEYDENEEEYDDYWESSDEFDDDYVFPFTQFVTDESDDDFIGSGDVDISVFPKE